MGGGGGLEVKQLRFLLAECTSGHLCTILGSVVEKHCDIPLVETFSLLAVHLRLYRSMQMYSTRWFIYDRDKL